MFIWPIKDMYNKEIWPILAHCSEKVVGPLVKRPYLFRILILYIYFVAHGRPRVCIIGPTYFIEIIDYFLGIIEILSVIGDNLVIKFELLVVIKIRISGHKWALV